VPVVKKETVGRLGQTEGQPEHTREAKLGCVFTQTTGDEQGYAIRDPDATTYVGAIETAEEFGKRIYLEAFQRGCSRAEKKVGMGEGAEWIGNLTDPEFPGATQIVDLYRARQHLWELAHKRHPPEESGQNRWMMIHQDLLDNGKIQKLVTALRSIPTPSGELAERSGPKRSTFGGMRGACGIRSSGSSIYSWAPASSKPGARHLSAPGATSPVCSGLSAVQMPFWLLRCCQFNGRFEDYWEARPA
jgi:hypothetical protein